MDVCPASVGGLGGACHVRMHGITCVAPTPRRPIVYGYGLSTLVHRFARILRPRTFALEQAGHLSQCGAAAVSASRARVARADQISASGCRVPPCGPRSFCAPAGSRCRPADGMLNHTSGSTSHCSVKASTAPALLRMFSTLSWSLRSARSCGRRTSRPLTCPRRSAHDVAIRERRAA